MPRLLALASVLVILFSAAGAWSELYRWTDESGERHVTNESWRIPEQYREAALADVKAREGGGSLNHGDESHNASPSAPARASHPASAADTPGVIGGKSEDGWRSQSLAMQRKIEDAEAALETATEEEEDEAGDVYFAPGAGRKARRPMRAAALSGDYEEDPTVEQLEAEVERAKSEFEAFEDRARRAGVPPGWLR